MKIFNFFQQINKYPELCYNTVHMHGALSNVINCSCSTLQDATHMLLLDVPSTIDNNIESFINFRNGGGKVVLMTFDPYNFKRVDSYIEQGMLDMVVVFDSQFKNRFNIKTYVTDYFFNEKVFPTNNVEYKNQVCIFGHLVYRHNEHNLPKVDVNVSSYTQLYNNVRMFNGVAVFDNGLNEDGSALVTYNKAKAVETLMCGRNPYCMQGINTTHYNKYLKSYSDVLSPKQVDISQETIFKINRDVLNLLAEQIITL